MKSSRSGLVFLSILIMICFSGTMIYAEMHPGVDNCAVCHYGQGGEGSLCTDSANLKMVREQIDTPSSGLKTVVFESRPEDLADGDATYDGVCEVCHTQTPVHDNDGDGVNHFDGSDCMTCHPHSQADATVLFSAKQEDGPESHHTHIHGERGPGLGCLDCHLNHSNYGLFADGLDLDNTNECNNCHSAAGTFGGVAMAKANWDSGLYDVDGMLKAGAEDWCLSCHDDQPANSQADGTGVNAPNVIGDNVDYGFYVTGHKINCLSCHDASKEHIDHEHRTYEVDDATYAAINPYADSYRLQVASNKASSTLCFVCHNSTEVLGASSSDVSHTNFWNNDDDIANSHWLHVVSFTGIHFDSDWDGAIDSAESCITCHNVHGSSTQAMVRHGELISSYGTTDKVPALNFAYLVEPSEFDTATWTPDLAADTYAVYARWKSSSNRATNAKYTIYYNGSSDSVEVNQQINGDQWNLLGTYPFAAGTSGYVELTDEGADGFVIADAVGWDTDGGAPDVVVDDGDAGFATVGDWTCPSGSGGYGDDYCYAKAAPEPILDAGVEDSVGGRMSYAGPGVGDNGVCWACHGAISYERPAYLGPRVIMGQAEPDTVVNDGSGTSLITVFVSDTSATGVPDVDTVEIDLTPIGGSADQLMNNDGGGYYSYQVTIPTDTPDSPLTFVFTATDDDMNTGEGEAKLTVVDPDSIYVDNAEAAFVCDWGVSATGGYRDDYSWHAAGTGSCTATWTPNVPSTETYNVYAWWKASSNRATDSPYTIYYDGGSETVDVNQEINGDQWNLLGTYPFAAGQSGYVVLSDDADEYVIADAVKFEP